VIVTHVNDDKELARRRVSNASDVSHDSVSLQSVLDLHRKTIPDVANWRFSVFSSCNISIIRGESNTRYIISVLDEVTLSVGSWIVNHAD